MALSLEEYAAHDGLTGARACASGEMTVSGGACSLQRQAIAAIRDGRSDAATYSIQRL